MFRRSCWVLAAHIPRSVWDPKHHNPNWADSYSTEIADRRHWPAKRWSIGLEPRTPSDWLQFSHRNLAYAYNGALRACATFPEMLVYYKEMKQRGVKVDVDTLNVMLTRAARYEQIQTDDVFLLFDEMTSLGARPDIASAETLHTVLEHSASQPFEWREARRRQLVELYNALALEEIERLAPHHVDGLLAQQINRIRRNLRQLKASLSASVYRRYLASVDSGNQLLREIHQYLWEFVEDGHPALDVPSLQMRIPFVASVLRRPPADADPASLQASNFEDSDVCSVLLAAIERCVDREFHEPPGSPVPSERRMYLSLLTMLTSSGVLYTSDVMAQLMDMVKYSRNDIGRDNDAIRLLRYALRGSSAAQDEAYRALWRRVEPVVDARVVGRYIASRDPWSPLRICYDERFSFGSYPAPQLIAARQATSTAAAASRTASGHDETSGESSPESASVSVAAPTMAAPEGDTVESLVTTSTSEGSNAGEGSGAARKESRSADALQLRWDDIKRLIDRTGVLQDRSVTGTRRPAQERMEVFTGQLVFLRTVATGQRYGSVEAAMATQAVGEDTHAAVAAAAAANRNSSSGDAGTTTTTASTSRSAPTTPMLFADGLDLSVWRSVFTYLTEVRQEMEKFVADHAGQVEPEFEAWESMLVVLRSILDYCVLYHHQHSGRGPEESLFNEAAALRATLVQESLTRFNGRMRILWLQES